MDKLKLFSLNLPFESAEDVQTSLTQTSSCHELANLKEKFPVTQAHLPNGKTIPLLKTMQTSICENNCHYCCFRSGRDTPRASLTPDELAAAVVKLSQAGIAQGVFLSSGITGGGVRTQDRILATAEILRTKYQYPYYIHLKIMPGAEKDQIFRSMQLADRVSINLEGPNESILHKLAPRKVFFADLLKPIQIIHQIRQEYPSNLGWNRRWPSSATQFVIGAAGESDCDLLHITASLYSKYNLKRAYYSRFTPVIDTPFENLPPASAWRQHRLYQAFFLLRDYGFGFEEMPFTQNGNLQQEIDPKLAWAETTLLESPIEINTAPYQQLLKIPGIGPITAQKILNATRYGKIRDAQTLRKMGISTQRAARFILLNGHRPAYQAKLFNET